MAKQIKRSKAFWAIFLAIGLIAGNLLITSCCEESYAYRWLTIITDNADNGIITKQDSVTLSGYSVRVRMLSKKEHKTGFNFIPEAKAVDCFPYYVVLDSITAIRVWRLNPDQSAEELTSHFTGNIYYSLNSSENAYPLSKLASQLNSNYYGFGESLMLEPESGYYLTGTMRVMVEFCLSDNRILRDTTETITITP